MCPAVTDRSKPHFNGVVLRWARESSGVSIDEAAKKAGTTSDKVQAWEAELDVPTVRQARMLAELYDRPFLEFFRDELPVLAPLAPVPDFRLYHDASELKENRELTKVRMWAEEQRLNTLDLYEILGEDVPQVPAWLASSSAVDPERAAAEIRKSLNVPIEAQVGIPASERASFPRVLREKLERIGILVLKASSLRSLDARGLCIAQFPLPIIVFGNEAPSAQAFTIVHELGHVALKQSGISGAPNPKSSSAYEGTVEDWCNAFSAAFLVPEDILSTLIRKPPNPAPRIDDAELKALARQFAISPHAMVIRLVKLGYIRSAFYWDEKRPQLLKEEQDYRAGGRSEYYGSRYRSSRGDLYTSLVLEAWSTGRITNHNAAEFMGIKNIRHLEDIRSRFDV